MKTLKLVSAVFTFFFALTVTAQTAEEIVDTFIENIGGQDAWSKVENMKFIGIGRQQGVDYPFTAYYMKDGRYVIEIDLQGTPFIVEAFDGENAWSMNFQTQKAEAADSEASKNVKSEAKDEMMSPFLNYKDKGYKVELVGTETWDGTDTFKIKLTKQPEVVDGIEEENIDMFYFSVDDYVPLAMEDKVTSGPAKGAMMVTEFTDYQEKDGLYMPFTQIEKFDGNAILEIIIKTFEYNVEIDETVFKMPED